MHQEWRRYAETELWFPASGLRVDLRIPLSEMVARRLADLGLDRAFGIITACNPLGSRLDPAGNRRLAAVLENLVRDRYPSAIPVTGRSPDGSHQEPGWAIAAPLEELQRLALGFLQNALFWFDGAQFSLIPVLAAGPVLPLPPPPDGR